MRLEEDKCVFAHMFKLSRVLIGSRQALCICVPITPRKVNFLVNFSVVKQRMIQNSMFPFLCSLNSVEKRVSHLYNLLVFVEELFWQKNTLALI